MLILSNTADFVAYLERLDQESLLKDSVAIAPIQALRVADTSPVEIPIKVTIQSDRKALEYMWRRGVTPRNCGVSDETINSALLPQERLVLRYYLYGGYGDPWSLAQWILGRHGLDHTTTLEVLLAHGLIEQLPAYRHQNERSHERLGRD